LFLIIKKMKSIIADTIEKIKEENIRPESRWKYLAKKYSVWLSFFVVAFVGAAAFSAADFLVSQLDWDVYPAMHRGSIFFFLSFLPYFWIVPIVVLAILAFFSLRRTENGYRYNFLKITLVVLGSLIVLGSALASFGFGRKMNGAAIREFPGYGQLVTTKESQWSQPEIGLLAGTVNGISKNSIDLRDFSGKEWQVAYDENTIVRPAVDFESGEMIKTIGQKTGGQTFKASEIRPWQGNGQMKKKNGQMNGRGK
jgi:hypothetical protein